MDIAEAQKTVLMPEEARAYLSAHPDVMLVDVREPGEYRQVHIQDARLMPLATLPEALEGIPKDQDLLFHCASGGRSAQALAWARGRGFKKAKHMLGGISAWVALGLPYEL